MPEKPEYDKEFIESSIKKVYELILKAFEDFRESKGEELDLGSLIRICLACNCPDAEMAEQLLDMMVRNGILEWREDEDGRILFRVKDRSDN